LRTAAVEVSARMESASALTRLAITANSEPAPQTAPTTVSATKPLASACACPDTQARHVNSLTAFQRTATAMALAFETKRRCLSAAVRRVGLVLSAMLNSALVTAQAEAYASRGSATAMLASVVITARKVQFARPLDADLTASALPFRTVASVAPVKKAGLVSSVISQPALPAW